MNEKTYICKVCGYEFNSLIQYKKEDKMFQLCPKCKSEVIQFLRNLTEDEKVRLIREKKLEKILEKDKTFNDYQGKTYDDLFPDEKI